MRLEKVLKDNMPINMSRAKHSLKHECPWPKENMPMNTLMFMDVFDDKFSWVKNMAMFEVRESFRG